MLQVKPSKQFFDETFGREKKKSFSLLFWTEKCQQEIKEVLKKVSDSSRWCLKCSMKCISKGKNHLIGHLHIKWQGAECKSVVCLEDKIRRVDEIKYKHILRLAPLWNSLQNSSCLNIFKAVSGHENIQYLRLNALIYFLIFLQVLSFCNHLDAPVKILKNKWECVTDRYRSVQF